MCRSRYSPTCTRRRYHLHLLRAMRAAEAPSSQHFEACHVTCHVKFGLSSSWQIIPLLILTRGRLTPTAIPYPSIYSLQAM